MNNTAANNENNQSCTINWVKEIAALDSPPAPEFTSYNAMTETQLKNQINALLAKLKQSYHVIKSERAEKQNTVTLLKEKLHEINNLHNKINTMNETIRCCQEHITINCENYHVIKNKMAYLTTQLQAAEKALNQKDTVIQNLKTDHEESMRKAKMLIDEFYQHKFLADITYSEERELIETENNLC